jgi:spore germination cell wall hydrolase CwlJ-like protein
MKFTRTPALAAPMLALVLSMLGHTAYAAPSKEKTSELNCLATAMYFEARGESAEGQLAVGQVILNRTEHPAYPHTVCGVVYQNAGRRNACQFSFACDKLPDTVRDKKAFAQIEERARKLLDGHDHQDEGLSTSTHYHAVSVSPGWAKKLKRTGRVGNHVFYYSRSA